MVRLGGALLAGLLDAREWHGLSLWTKPIKFAIGFALYLMSLGCFAAFIDPDWRQRRVFRATILAGLVAIAMEQAIITLQSARGVGSHFNFATAFDAALYSAMGAGSLVLLATMHAVPLAVLMLGPLLRLGLRGVVGVAAIYGAFVLAVFAQALPGHAFLAFTG